MAKGLSAQELSIIQKNFPKLLSDSNFKITSKATPEYNCISWALVLSDRWTQCPAGMKVFDGVTWWPPDAKDGMEISCLIDAFEKTGHIVCDNGEPEPGFRKVALYCDNNNQWTHAARLLSNGFWTSKLGAWIDIQHGNPYSIEGPAYGAVYCFMKYPMF
ncbi:MAG: hypothetical protein ACI31F_05815 [Muribaculaceae bacterium]